MVSLLVSILIRSIDRPFLAQALESIALQSYAHIEVLVVAARPQHAALPDKCGSFDLRLIQTNRELERSAAANVALAEAQGEFLLFLDDDDWLMPEHVSRLVDSLMQQPDALAAYSDIALFDINAEPVGQIMSNPFDAVQLLSGNLMPIHAVLFRARALDVNCHFDETLDRFEDWDFWLQLAHQGPIVHVPGVGGGYRIHNSSGVHEEGGTSGPSYLRIYHKWKHRWTDADVSQMMQRLWEYSDLTLKLVESTDRINVLERELMALNTQFMTLNTAHQTVLKSRSMRITYPLRWISAFLSQMGRGGSFFSQVDRAFGVFCSQGLSGLWKRLQRNMGAATSHISDYSDWVKSYHALSASDMARLKESLIGLKRQPLITVLLPICSPHLEFLYQAVSSVRAQIYPHWELCIACDDSADSAVKEFLQEAARHDGRIKLMLREKVGCIVVASNSALALAQGEYIALLDPSDLLTPDALFWVADAINARVDAALIFSDEDKLDLQGQRCDPYFKSDWNLELFLSQNMISHLGVYRTDLIRDVGGFRLGYEGSHDYDLALRCALRIKQEQIVHIPRVLYHWRMLASNTAQATQKNSKAQKAGQRALADFLTASALGGHVECLPNGYYRVHPPALANTPLVTLVIPTRNAHELVRQCIESILSKTTYSNYDVLLIDNGSDEPTALQFFKELALHPKVKVIRDDRAFNYSALNNLAVREAKGEWVCLLNNDIEVLSPNWLEEMLGLAMRPGVGAVGAKLLYPNETLQHGGIILGLGGLAGHAHHCLGRYESGYFGRASLTHAVSAVTAACLLVRKSIYLEVGGLNEQDLQVAYNDVDFCLRLACAGYRNVWTPFAEMIHHESATRGKEDSKQKKARFSNEVDFMHRKWSTTLSKDPFYNPNLQLTVPSYKLAFPPR